MSFPRTLAPWLVSALLGAGSAQAACLNSQIFPMQVVLHDIAQVGMVGHVDNGTKVDGGSYRAELVVDQALVDAVAASLAGGCTQTLHQVSVGNITLLGIGTGSYSAATQVVAERPSIPLRRRVGPVMRDTGGSATGGTVDHAHDPRLPRTLVLQMQLGDVIALEGTATATGTIINGWVADQVQVLYGWGGLTPWLEVRVP